MQVVWAELVRRTPGDVRLLTAGAVANVAVAAVWLVSRTTGLPIGPGAGRPEPVGVKDVLATADELGLALLVALVLARIAAPRLAPVAWAFAVASAIAALLPGGH